MTWQVLVLNGPNLNLLGEREPEIYGGDGLEAILTELEAHAEAIDCAIRHHQSNHEGELIDRIHEARTWADGIVLNAGAYTHTSVAIRDAIAGVGLPVVEVHLSNTAARERFRHRSYLAPVCVGVVSGFGAASYRLGLEGLIDRLRRG